MRQAGGGGRIDWALLVAVLGFLLALAQFFDPMGMAQRVCALEAAAKRGPCGQ
jgi:hypothetical protein